MCSSLASLKGLVHPKIKVVSLCTRSHVILNPLDLFLGGKHKPVKTNLGLWGLSFKDNRKKHKSCSYNLFAVLLSILK